MLVRAGLVSSSVIGLNVWQANKVHAEPSTSQQPSKKKIRPSEVSEPIVQVFCSCLFYLHVKNDARLKLNTTRGN